MNREELLKRIREKEKRDRKNRRDPRFRNTMGFLVSKGFLYTNLNIPALPNKRIRIEDAIWAGKTVEPRILEVLPAAVLRLEKHFDFDETKHPELARVLRELKMQHEGGNDFFGIPFEKLKVWVNLPLKDGRTKIPQDRKISKTFRLKPTSLTRLKALSKLWGCTQTEALERSLEKDPSVTPRN